MELSKFIQSESDVMPKCLESLLHHSKLLGCARDIVDLNGLPLLMEIYHRNKKNIDIIIKLCEMLAQLSYHKSILEPLYKSGNLSHLIMHFPTTNSQKSLSHFYECFCLLFSNQCLRLRSILIIIHYSGWYHAL